MRYRAAMACAMFFSGIFCGQPAEAYYWGYSPYSLTSLLWPLSSLFYRGGLYNPYRYIYSPAYATNSLVYAARYNTLTRRPQTYLEPYEDEEPVYSPRQRSRPVRPANQPVDQLAHARWLSPGNGGMPPVHPGAVYDGPAGNHTYLQPAAEGSSGAVVPPGVVPASAGPHQLPLLAPEAGTKGGFQTNAPLAAGFITHVNTRFEGNLQRALADADTRQLARAIGILPDGVTPVISDEKTATISGVLRDDTVEPLTKLQTVKLLLKH